MRMKPIFFVFAAGFFVLAFAVSASAWVLPGRDGRGLDMLEGGQVKDVVKASQTIPFKALIRIDVATPYSGGYLSEHLFHVVDLNQLPKEKTLQCEGFSGKRRFMISVYRVDKSRPYFSFLGGEILAGSTGSGFATILNGLITPGPPGAALNGWTLFSWHPNPYQLSVTVYNDPIVLDKGELEFLRAVGAQPLSCLLR